MGKQTDKILGLKNFGIHVKPLKRSRSKRTTFAVVVDAYSANRSASVIPALVSDINLSLRLSICMILN